MGATGKRIGVAAALFGKARLAVLTLLFGRPDESFYLRQISAFAGVGQGAVQREVERLTNAGLLVRSRRGQHVYYQANRNSAVFDETSGLVTKMAAEQPATSPRAGAFRRRSIRLKEYDYSQPGAYFVTICTHDRECILGKVTQGRVELSETGEIVRRTWLDLANHCPGVNLDEFVVMPNHVHVVIMLTRGIVSVGAGSKPALGVGGQPRVRAGLEPAPTTRYGLPEVIRQFKTFSARRVNEVLGTPGVPLWQRNYYEHVVRNEEDLNQIRAYIQMNPSFWARDEENPHRERWVEPL